MKIIIIPLVLLLAIITGCDNQPDVITKASGIKYADDSTGTGETCKNGDMITFHFKGWMINQDQNLFEDWTYDTSKAEQKIFSSYEYGEPVKFVLGEGGFIQGTDEAFVGMKKGGVRTIIVPYKFAKSVGPIPPNTDLKLVIKLLDSKKNIPVKQWDVDTTKYIKNDSGLKYVILKDGEGVNAVPGDTVSVHYSGFLSTGRKFDSSVERGEPFTFILGESPVIKGWEEGIALLNKGAKARLVIPPSLGYGSMPMGQIPANSTLYFDVELVDIK